MSLHHQPCTIDHQLSFINLISFTVKLIMITDTKCTVMVTTDFTEDITEVMEVMVLASVALVSAVLASAMLALVVLDTLVVPNLAVPVQDSVVDTEAMKDSPWITMVDSVKVSVNETKSQLHLLSMLKQALPVTKQMKFVMTTMQHFSF